MKHNPFQADHFLGVLSPPAVWMAHLLLCYLLVSLTCSGIANNDTLAVGMALFTSVALALIAYIGLLNYRKWQRQRNSASLSRFLALNALLASGLSAIALIWVLLPSIWLPPCAA